MPQNANQWTVWTGRCAVMVSGGTELKAWDLLVVERFTESGGAGFDLAAGD
jgi:hypothetical protein